jgi:hypothetical protein
MNYELGIKNYAQWGKSVVLLITASLLLVGSLFFTSNAEAARCRAPESAGSANFSCLNSVSVATCNQVCTTLSAPTAQCTFFANDADCVPTPTTETTKKDNTKGCIEGVNCVKLQNPLGEGRDDLRIVVGQVIQKVLTIIGSITLLVFVIGGVMWLTSGGNQEKVTKGTKTMVYAVIGIVVIFSAYAILNTVIRTLTGVG